MCRPKDPKDGHRILRRDYIQNPFYLGTGALKGLLFGHLGGQGYDKVLFRLYGFPGLPKYPKQWGPRESSIWATRLGKLEKVA